MVTSSLGTHTDMLIPGNILCAVCVCVGVSTFVSVCRRIQGEDAKRRC